MSMCECLIMLISLTSRCLRIVCFTDDLRVWELGLCCHTRRQKRWAGSYLIKLINICLECLTTHTHTHTNTYIQACSAYCHLMPLSRQANSRYRYGYVEQLIFWHFLQLWAVSIALCMCMCVWRKLSAVVWIYLTGLTDISTFAAVIANANQIEISKYFIISLSQYHSLSLPLFLMNWELTPNKSCQIKIKAALLATKGNSDMYDI